LSSTFSTTGSASNLTRLELEQLRKSDAFANGKALTIGDSGLAPEGVVGIGSVTAEPYFSGPQVALADLLSAKVPGQPGIGVGHDTLFPTTPTLGGGSTATVGDAPFWYGPTQIGVGTTGAATAINQWADAAGEFVLAGPGYDVQPGDYLVINRRTTLVGDLNDSAVGTVSVVAAGLLTLTDIWNPSNIGLETELDPTNGDLFTYSVIRPGAVQLFAVPGSGPVGQEQTFLFVQPGSTLHSNPSPSLGAINADRLTSIVSPRFASAPTVDRSDSIYGSPAPRTALDQLGYRVVFYPDDGAGNPDFTAPIASLNPLIDPAIPAADQRVTIDYTSGTVRFSCAPTLTGDIKVAGGVDGTTGRLNLYATFFSYRNTVASSAAAQKLFVTRSSTQTTELPARMVWDEANATWVFHTPNPVRLASATSPQLRQMDGTNSNISIVQRVNSIGVSVGDGTTSFGDFNGTNAIAQVLAYWGLAGTQSLRVHVKRGTYTVTALDVPAGLELILQGDGRQDTELTLTPSGAYAFSVETGSQLVLEDMSLIQAAGNTGRSLGSIRGKRCLLNGAPIQFGMGNSYRAAASGLRVLSAHFEDSEFTTVGRTTSCLNFLSTVGSKKGFLFERCTFESPGTGEPAITAGVGTAGVANFSEVNFVNCDFTLHGIASTSATYTSGPTGLLYLDPAGGADLNLTISDWAFRHCNVAVADEVVDNKILLHLLPIAYDATNLTLRARVGKFTIEGGTWSVPTTQGSDFAPFFLMAEHPVIKDFTFTGCGTVYGTFQTAPEYRGNGYWSNPMKLALNDDVAMPPVPQRETAFSVSASGTGLITDPNLNGLTIRNLRLSHFHRASRSGELFLQGPDLKGNAIDVDGIVLSDYLVGAAETSTPFSRVTIRPGGTLTSHRGTMGVYRNVHLNLQPTNVNTVDWTSSSLVNLSTEGDLQAENFVIEGWVSNTSAGCQVGRIGIDINNTWGSNPTVRGFVSLRNSRSLGMGTGVRVNGNPSGFDLDRVLVNMQASSAGDPSYGIQVVPSTCPIYPSRISSCTVTTNNLPAASTYQGVSVAITTWLAFNPLHVVDNSVFLSTVENAITADNRAFAILSADAGSVVSCIFRGNSGYANATVTSEVLRARLQRGNSAALSPTAVRGAGAAYVGVEVGNDLLDPQQFMYDTGQIMLHNSLIMETP